MFIIGFWSGPLSKQCSVTTCFNTWVCVSVCVYVCVWMCVWGRRRGEERRGSEGEGEVEMKLKISSLS